MKTTDIKSSPDQVCKHYSGNKVKLKVLQIKNENTILIEGDEESLEFLGNLLLAQAKFEKDCGFSISPDGSGSTFFNKESTFGLYIHRLPCMNQDRDYLK